MDAITLRGVTKQFRRRAPGRSYTTLKSELVRWLRDVRRPRAAPADHFEVLRGIDLTVPRGVTMGLVGKNGSGKSTLLKLMTGIYRPTSGTIVVDGRVSALLELGAGFHPDFSGRENVLINGVILGMSRAEVRARMGEIIAFSELEEFIDQPVRTYSSGMYMRLAFSVATHVEPDVLIVDEILAVGDEHFARKSLAKMIEFKRRGKTIVLVTHDLASVERWCDQAAWIHEGRIREVGEPKQVTHAYRRAVFEGEHAPAVEAPAAAGGPAPGSPDSRFGTGAVQLLAVRFEDAAGATPNHFDPEQAMTIAIDYAARDQVEDVVFGIGLYAADGRRVYGTNTQVEAFSLPRPLPPRGTLRFEMTRLGFVDGNYSVEVAAHSTLGEVYDWQRGGRSFLVRSTTGDIGVARPPHRWSFTEGEARRARGVGQS